MDTTERQPPAPVDAAPTEAAPDKAIPLRDRIASDSVVGHLFREGYRFEFFQAVWLLEQLLGARGPAEVFDVDQRRDAARIRIAPHASTTFPAADVRSVAWTGDEAVDVTVTFMGLYGVDSPLPRYFYEHIAQEPDDYEGLRAFLDIFNHRLYTLFYRSWKKYRPALAFAQSVRNAHARAFQSLAGLGIHAASRGDAPVPRSHPAHLRWAAFAGRLAGHVRNRQGLEVLLSDALGLTARVVENVGRWARLRDRSTMGRGSARALRLGRGGVVGRRVFDVAGKFRVVLGPLSLSEYEALLPGGEKAALLQAVVDLYLHDTLDYDVELRLDTSELDPAILGHRHARLGSTAWLRRPASAVVSEIVTYDAASKAAA